MKLGLLFETGFDEATEKESPTFVAFQHKSFQEYTSSYFIRRQLEKKDDRKVNLYVFSQPLFINYARWSDL